MDDFLNIFNVAKVDLFSSHTENAKKEVQTYVSSCFCTSNGTESAKM